MVLIDVISQNTSSNTIGDGKGEITSTTTGKGDATFDNVGSRSPLRFGCENFDKLLEQKNERQTLN